MSLRIVVCVKYVPDATGERRWHAADVIRAQQLGAGIGDLLDRAVSERPPARRANAFLLWVHGVRHDRVLPAAALS